jgi:predicted ATPase/class 3 adenylate cyclase
VGDGNDRDTQHTPRDDHGVAEQRLPSGVVTFVLTDIVGSTRLWESAPAAMEIALARHEAIVTAAVVAHRGVVLRARGEGDSTFSVFSRATDALASAYAAQVGLGAEPWPSGACLTVRFAVHSGESVERNRDYLGPAVNRAARLRAVAQGGEVLVSESTARLAADGLPSGVRLVDLGEVQLRDLDRPEPTYLLVGPGLPEPRAGPDRRATSDGPVFPAPFGFPPAVTPLVDRKEELSQIVSLLAVHNLVTLVGAGGTGKTRLATHVLTTAGGGDSGSAWCAELAAVSSRDGVADVVLAALGIRSGTDVEVSERVARYLSTRTGLLVLDNCEHVRGPVATICERILQFAPSVRILATSREPLGIAGEVLLVVPPLKTPSDDAPTTIAAADAVQLFVERARSYKRDFCLDADNAVPVAELCRSLDGLPLAIELAAARVPTMTAQEIVARLDQRFRILGHQQERADHHRTLRATLDWSYDLLDDDERVLLTRLAMFAPGFSLAAVEAVGQGDPQGRYVLDVLSGLVAKSMVVADTTGTTTRLRLLESVRAYAGEKVESDGHDDAIRRHVHFYARLAEELAGPTVNADVDARNDQLAAEAANLRLALEYAVDTNDVVSVLDLTATLVDMWCLWGWGSAILNALEAVLDDHDHGAPGLAQAMADAAWSAWSQGRHAKAMHWCEQSERCSTSDGQPPVGRANVIRGLCRLLDLGDLAGGAALCERGLEQLRLSGHLRRYAHDLAACSAYLSVVGDNARAQPFAVESEALARQLGDQHTLALALNALGYVSIASDTERARAHFKEVIGIGDPWCAASACWGLGWLEDVTGNDPRAIRCYEQALELWSETGDWRGIFYAVQGVAIVATRAGRGTTAVRLFAGSEALAPDIGASSMPQWNSWRERHLDRLRADLSAVEFSSGWSAGERFEPGVLVKEALIEARRSATPDGASVL